MPEHALRRPLSSPKQGSLHGCQLAALNGLSPEARCAIKARRIAALGPPVNILVKVRLPALGSAR